MSEKKHFDGGEYLDDIYGFFIRINVDTFAIIDFYDGLSIHEYDWVPEYEDIE